MSVGRAAVTRVDPDVLTVPEAAAIAGCSRWKLLRDLADDPELRSAIVIDWPGQTRISRPRLLRRLHGEEAGDAKWAALMARDEPAFGGWWPEGFSEPTSAGTPPGGG